MDRYEVSEYGLHNGTRNSPQLHFSPHEGLKTLRNRKKIGFSAPNGKALLFSFTDKHFKVVRAYL